MISEIRKIRDELRAEANELESVPTSGAWSLPAKLREWEEELTEWINRYEDDGK
jgi:hypothetical protein